MPTLDILNEDGSLKQFAPVIVVSVMFHPTDEKRRDEYFAVNYAVEATDVGQSIPPEITSLIIHGPGARAISQNAHHQMTGGLIAGNILDFILRCAEHKPEDASIRKAVHVTSQILTEERNSRYPTYFPAALSAINNAWSKYKSVCHMWAAWEAYRRSVEVLNSEHLVAFLSTAERYLVFAENHYPPPKRAGAKPLLSPGEAWTVPEGMALQPTPNTIPPLTTNELSLLPKYRSSPRKSDEP